MAAPPKLAGTVAPGFTINTPTARPSNQLLTTAGVEAHVLSTRGFPAAT